ncbi:hypothetical protein FB107DRAFT_278309 [Schizophyllum commune]
MATPTSTRTGRVPTASKRSVAAELDADAIATAAGTLKRKAPGKAPAPRAKRSSASAAGEIAAPVIAKMQLSKTQAAAVLAHKAVSDKQASAAQSARRQLAKQNKTLASSASASAVDELAKKNAVIQARLVAALAADEDGLDEDGDRSHLKKQKVHVVEGQEDDLALFEDMPLLMEVSSDSGEEGEGAAEAIDETDEGIDDNGIQVFDLTPVTPKKAKRTRRGKIAEADFTPRTAKLAKSAKVQARTRTATEDAFPGEANAAAYLDLSRAVDRATGPDAVIFRQAFERLQLDADLQEDVFTFVNYASSGMRGDVSSKVKETFVLLSGIPGEMTVEEIVETIKWLRTDMNYMYGDLDIKARKVNRNMPFQSPFIKPVIAAVCFGQSKANRNAARTMISHREISVTMFALVGAAIENVLKSWGNGIPSPGTFTEEAGRERQGLRRIYLRHRSSFNMLQASAPRFTRKLQYTLLATILRDAGKSHLLDGYLTPSPGHLQGVDFEALEASVGSEEEDFA